MSEYPLTEKVKSNSSANETERFYIYGPTGIIALVDNGSNYFVVKDHLGSARVVLDKNSFPVSYYDYTAYGGKLSTTVNLDPHYQFTGQEYDGESNLYNFRARLYDSNTGIFYSMDPAGQNYFPYSYCGNNPVIYKDPTGKIFGIDDLLFVGILAAVGGYTGGAVANHDMNPFDWKWNSKTWTGIGIGAFSGAFLGSGIALGGAYGTAVGSAALNTVDSYLGGARDWQLLGAAAVGFGTGYFAATGGLGMAGTKEAPSIGGRLGAQAISTSTRSIGNNLVMGRSAFGEFSMGIGPLNFRFNHGIPHLMIKDNYGTAIANGIGALGYGIDHIILDNEKSSLSWDWASLSPVWGNEGTVGKIWPNATGAFAQLATWNKEISHEGIHVFQSRFWGNSIFGTGWLPLYFFDCLNPIGNGKNIHYNELFEHQAEFGWR